MFETDHVLSRWHTIKVETSSLIRSRCSQVRRIRHRDEFHRGLIERLFGQAVDDHTSHGRRGSSRDFGMPFLHLRSSRYQTDQHTGADDTHSQAHQNGIEGDDL
ncbi:MAG TPA: hypothetical protein VGE27_05160 [Gemmatimonas sp.]